MKKPFLILVFSTIFFSNTFAQKKSVTIEDIWRDYKFIPASVDGFYSMKDGKHYTAMDGDEKNSYLIKYDFKTGQAVDTLVDVSKMPDEVKNMGEYTFNEDESALLLPIDTRQIYRRSREAFYYIYSIKNNTAIPLNTTQKQMNPTISPDGSKVAYMIENNVYIRDLISNTESQITKDGLKNNIINGGTDWVYEEEFELVQGISWSPDSKNIAFMKFNESEVPTFTLQYFKDLYPENYTYKYPKVGEKNADVSIHIYNLENKNTKEVITTKNTEDYLPRFLWLDESNQLCITRINRLQNDLKLFLFDAASQNIKNFFEEKSDTYIDINNYLDFFNHDKNFIWVSDKSGFRHIYNYNITGTLVNQITSGDFEITDVYGLDEKTSTIYYQSAEVSPLVRHIYKVSLDGKNKKQLINLIGSNTASFSSDFSYFMNENSAFNHASEFELYDNNGRIVRILEDNKKFKTMLDEYQVNYPETFRFNTSENIELNGWIIKPHNFDESKKYPLFMVQYSGPGSQEVLNEFSSFDLMYYNYLASQGYVVACVDGRGTGGRGARFQKVTYKNLGKYETLDQIEAAKYLKKYKWIDGDRIGIFGWSFGGYMSARCIGIGSDVFRLAISVAPVVDWRYYDSVYTERYMQTDKENKSGYDSTSVIPYVKRIKGKFLLIHGLADDNVHYQNTAMLLNALYRNNIVFDQMTFPNKNHGIYGGNTRYYLYSRMADYIKTNL